MSKNLQGIGQEEKYNVNWGHPADGDKDKNKAKFHNFSSVNSQPQTQISKKNKCQKYCQRDYLATGVNATEVVKKNKDKAKILSHIKYYTQSKKATITPSILKSQKTGGGLDKLHLND